ncbi:AAA family ATPase [Rhizobium ruizarguesonis]|uniref:AAA family ATPase n=1 Tax=Rhizobium ruizarguesonis TaxID=2081791 RepID=UPI0012EBA2DB|nr:AAA family ATPase [Rhizobium ruizarguesonis]QJS29303.1 AAA family ATPase [Rhizobium leguminosarum bv. trifolii TA1]UFW93462.1 ATP-binding protein [Rhizobium ruizarguesonis]
MNTQPVPQPIAGKVHVLTGVNGSGKTRYLSKLADHVIDELKAGETKFSHVLCLSGPVVDKFSQRVYRQTLDYEHFTYLGYRRNNNMFSETAPFRELFRVILQGNPDWQSLELAASCLKELHLDAVVGLLLPGERRGSESGYTLDFENWVRPRIPASRSTARAQFIFHRDGRQLFLQELSAGERSFLLLMLAFCFCLRPQCLVLIDEPETSLHPEWQLAIMRKLFAIVAGLRVPITVVVTTHSPLVVASIPNDTSLICEFPAGDQWTRKTLFGQTSDTVLSKQFGLNSPRSLEAIVAIQRCISLISEGRGSSSEFKAAVAHLETLHLVLSKSDALFKPLETIRKFARGLA